ncbi:zinc finger protein 319-like [Ornithodoros turicata]|uniref:zinc finger protein 319-like n=1 Tax=Ornithodoros turicata TaxID=34597 RepID=UPI003139E6E2
MRTGKKPHKCPAEFGLITKLQCHKQMHREGGVAIQVQSLSFQVQPEDTSVVSEAVSPADIHGKEAIQVQFLSCIVLQQHGPSTLQAHAHTGKKPCKSDLCPAKFSRSVHLCHHKLTHTWEMEAVQVSPLFCCRSSIREPEESHGDVWREKTLQMPLCPTAFNSCRFFKTCNHGQAEAFVTVT